MDDEWSNRRAAGSIFALIGSDSELVIDIKVE